MYTNDLCQHCFPDSLPKITGCIVYNWEYMTCTWDPGRADRANETVLHWSIK